MYVVLALSKLECTLLAPLLAESRQSKVFGFRLGVFRFYPFFSLFHCKFFDYNVQNSVNLDAVGITVVEIFRSSFFVI